MQNERLGIDYCCGGKRPLADVCRQKGYDVAAIQRELDEALSGQTSAEVDWNMAPLSDLVNHIVKRHHEYLRRELPAIAARIAKVDRVYNQRYGPTLVGLPQVFSALQTELSTHLEKEERILFPAITGYEAAVNSRAALPRTAFGTVSLPISVMEAEHDDAGNALAKIREITADFSIPDYACVTYKAMIRGLQELEQDLHMHIHLENNILFPRAIRLEAEHQ